MASSIDPEISDFIEFVCGSVSIRAQFVEDNQDVIQHVKDGLPISTLTDHVLTAGETILYPFPITFMGRGKAAPRLPGTVYCNLGSKALAICYGDVKQAGTVNQIATVMPEDMQKLKSFGRLVKQKTQKMNPPYLFRTDIHIRGVSSSPTSQDERLSPPFPPETWQSAIEVIEWHAARLNGTEEPEEIKAIRLGAIEKSNEDGYFPNFFFGLAWLVFIGPHLIPSVLTAASKYNYSLEQKKGSLDEALFGNFDHFTFLSGHGLKELGEMGIIYRNALKVVDGDEQLDQLTASFRSYLAGTHRWVQRVFPWHLNKQFPKRSPEEVSSIAKLQLYADSFDTK